MSARLIMKLTVESVSRLSADVVALSLRHPRRPSLPPGEPGAHVDVHLPAGVRHYSLCGDPSDRARYVIAVKREADGRGGSRWLHDTVAVGDVLPVSAPRNHFPLEMDAPHHVLIGGGIGITPLVAMAHHLATAGASFEVHYAAAAPAEAFRETLSTLAGPRFSVYRGRAGGEPLDVGACLSAAPAGAHVYVCGPRPLSDAVRDAAAGWAEERVHTEAFEPLLDPNFVPEPFEIELARSGTRLSVSAEETALDVLRANGIAMPSSCELGVCGSCECGYLAGTVIHRDVVLPPARRKSRIILCVSRARGRLVLDL